MLRSNDNCAHHEVGMSVPEFCKRQYGNVDAPIEWLSKKRGSPSIVSRYQNIILARNCRNRRNVDNIECHRSRAFQVYHPGRRPEACRLTIGINKRFEEFYLYSKTSKLIFGRSKEIRVGKEEVHK